MGFGCFWLTRLCVLEKEVRKANRELHSQTAKMDSLQKIDHLSKRCTDLLHEMKRLERESQKNKKRTDQLQKERDQSRSELSKTIGLKEKLEKLCRELQKENNKLKVRPVAPHTFSTFHFGSGSGIIYSLQPVADMLYRTRTGL